MKNIFDKYNVISDDENGDSFSFFPFDLDSVLNEEEDISGNTPILALKNSVLFPGVIMPITISRERSIKAIKHAYDNGKKTIGVVTQKDFNISSPKQEDLYSIGTLATILKIIKMPDGSTTAILRGKKRFYLKTIESYDPFMIGNIKSMEYINAKNNVGFEATVLLIKDSANKIIKLSAQIPPEASLLLKNIPNDKLLLNFIAFYIDIGIEDKQKLLEESDMQMMSENLLKLLDSEVQLLEVKTQIENKVREDVNEQQRSYLLNQQLKKIQEELGDNPQQEEIKILEEKASKKMFPKHAKKVFFAELDKLKRLNPQIAEYSVALNYLELFLDLPWDNYSEDNYDLKKAKKILDEDHFDLEKVKDRILEHLAVLKLKKTKKAPILCLVGPPGVGKTSLGKSVARALDREYIRISMGGLHDESEIRGHRRTYIGAMPGRIIQSLKKAGTSNPVFILDEIDKIGTDFRGDPSSALLEVLDPEQNSTFHDNYLNVDYDLSKVLFIATANGLNTIQPALRDRMEIVELGGYAIEEKIQIAEKYIFPEQLQEHGLKKSDIKIGKKALKTIISSYTREAGVRGLKRQIGAIMRHIAKFVAMNDPYDKSISSEDVIKILGPEYFSNRLYKESKIPGVTVGLAWTSVGGDILFVEASKNEGKGKLTLTGNLGQVMKESATTALSFIKSHYDLLGLKKEDFDNNDIHIHVPAGAIPKDGPSAGITMMTTIASALMNKPVKPYLAMTGEITLRGIVLPVGGIKEKILAAKRAGIKEVILCKENKKHIDEINKEYIKSIEFHYVENMEEVLKIALDL